jgi:RNA polymerase-binding transcription factor DksA
MPSTLMPPDRPHPALVTHLSLLRVHLESDRQFRLDQLAGITASAGVDAAREEVRSALETAARRALHDIEAALERIRRGRYGICLGCRRSIPVDRLRILPQTAHCLDCQRGTEEPQP